MTTPLSRAAGRFLLATFLAHASAALGQAPADRDLVRLQFIDRLTLTAPEDPQRPGHRHKVHACQLTAGTDYVIDLISSPTLTAQGAIEPNETWLAWLRDLYGREWLRQADAIRGQGSQVLQPGCYVALLDGTPFLEPGLRDPQSHKGTSVVYGIMKEPVEP